MGVLGELFPQPKINGDADPGADGQRFRIGPIDLESGVVQLQPTRRAEEPDGAGDESDGPRG